MHGQRWFWSNQLCRRMRWLQHCISTSLESSSGTPRTTLAIVVAHPLQQVLQEVHVKNRLRSLWLNRCGCVVEEPIAIVVAHPLQQVLQEVHVKNRCAWLNHSDR